MGKPTICIGENKGADQLRSNCETSLNISLNVRFEMISRFRYYGNSVGLDSD